MRSSSVVAWKEVLYVSRSWLVFVVAIQPLVFTLLWGYCASLELRDVKLAVLDQAATRESRELVRAFEGSGCFRVARRPSSPAELERDLKRSEASMGLLIARDPGKAFGRGRPAPVQVVVDGTDWNVANLGAAYASRIIAAATPERARSRVRPGDAYLSPVTRTSYLPDLDGTVLLLLGAIVYTLLMPLYNVSDSLISEREQGTIALVRAGRLTPLGYWLGLAPVHVALPLWGCLVQLGVTELIVPIPFRGGAVALLAGVCLLALIHVNLGCVLPAFVSVRRKRTIVVILLILVEISFAGYLIPLASLPEWVRSLAEIVPLKHGLVLVRALFLKGSGPDAVARELLALAGMALATMPFAVWGLEAQMRAADELA
jgi:ABC-2 type transport system permease protein